MTDGWRPEETDNQGEQGISHNGNNGRGGWGGWRHGRRDVHPWWDKYPHETEPLVLQSHYLDRQEQGQWRQRSDAADGESDWAEYRSLTGLPMEEAGLPYSQILHQHLAEPYRWELKAGGMRGTDPRHLFLYGNHQGSTVQVRDGDGRGALRLDYSPFGQVFLKHSDRHHWSPADSSASTLEQLGSLMPYQYTGRYTEAATGLVHLDARWYNPHTQRFMQPDLWNFRSTGLPSEIQHELMRFTGLDTNQLLRDPSQQVAYGYVSGNPLAWTDWLGLCETSLWSSFKGAVTDLGHQAVGTLEAAGTMATGTAASLGGGLTFLGTLALTGGDVEAASAVSQGVQQTLTYQPYSQHGNYYLNTLGNASAAAGDFYTENVADNVAEYAGPVAGTIAAVVPNMLPTKRVTAGLPGGAVQGGRYGQVRYANSGGEVHHMPANSVNGLPRSQGPAIHMSREDHRQTASHGGQGLAGAEYRASQKELVDAGRLDDAIQMDIDDIQSLFDSKYDDAILQMIDSLY